MAVTYVNNGAGNVVAGSLGTYTGSPAYPTGISANNLLILKAAARAGTSVDTIDTPSGFTLFSTVNLGGNVAQKIFWKIATGSESGTVTVTGTYTGAAPRLTCIIEQYTGNDPASPLESSATNTGSGTTPGPASVTTSRNGGLAVCAIASAAATTCTNITGETGGDYAEAYAEFSSSTMMIDTQTAALATAGTISGGSATIGAAADWVVSCFGIKPPVTASVASASGTGTATGVGASTAAQVASAAGVGAASAIGASTAASVGSAAGVGAASATSTTASKQVAAAAGTGAASGAGASTVAQVASAAAAGAATGIGASTVARVAASSGAGAASGVGASTAAQVASAAGIGAASATGASTAASVGSASGTSQALGVSSDDGSIASAAGTSQALGVSAVTSAQAGNAAGSSEALGVSAAITPTSTGRVPLGYPDRGPLLRGKGIFSTPAERQEALRLVAIETAQEAVAEAQADLKSGERVEAVVRALRASLEAAELAESARALKAMNTRAAERELSRIAAVLAEMHRLQLAGVAAHEAHMAFLARENDAIAVLLLS